MPPSMQHGLTSMPFGPRERDRHPGFGMSMLHHWVPESGGNLIPALLASRESGRKTRRN
jgi:hypothetical protein